MKLIIITIITALLGGCSQPPRPADLKGIPVISYGQKTPADKDFILHFKAGQPIDTRVNIHGNLLESGSSRIISVKLKKDIYAYRKWVSSDLKTWVDSDRVLGIKLQVKIPGPKYPKTGLIDLHIFEK